MGGQSGSWTPTKRRGPIAAEFQGPGPASLQLPSLFGNTNIKESSKQRSPAYTFGGRHAKKVTSNSPSPNSYNTAGLNPKGKDDPKAPSMHIKPKDPKQFVTPAPGAYNPEAADREVKQTAPKYSFGIKGKDDKIKDVPAPNAYSVQAPKDQPSYSLSSRNKEQKKYVTPAPGAYEAADTNGYKTKAPAYSLSTRYQIPTDHTMKPGPGAYTPEKVNLDKAPEYAFGIKHSPYMGTLKGDAVAGTTTELKGNRAVMPGRNSKASGTFTKEETATTTKATTNGVAVPMTNGSVVTNGHANNGLSNGHSSHTTVTRNVSGAGETTSSTRVHSDGHRIKTETITYTKGPTVTTAKVNAVRTQRTEVKNI